MMIPEIHGMDNIQHEDNPKIHGISSATQQIGTKKKGTKDADTRNPIPIVLDVDALLSNSKTEFCLIIIVLRMRLQIKEILSLLSQIQRWGIQNPVQSLCRKNKLMGRVG